MSTFVIRARGFVLEITCHIGAFCFDVRQFGAIKFGAFHFDAVPVRRVSLWRASTSARFTLARFHFGAFQFGAFPNFVRTYGDPVPANASFARADYLCACFFSAEKSCLPQCGGACFLSQGSYAAWKSLNSMEFHLLKIKALKAWNLIN